MEITSNHNNLSRATILFRVLRRQIFTITNTLENEDFNINNSSSSINSSNDSRVNQRFSTSVIGIKSLFERIFQGQIDLSKYINKEMSLGNISFNSNILLNEESDKDLTKKELNSLLKLLSNYENNFSNYKQYPLSINWEEIENGRTYAYEALMTFGYIGAYIYVNFNTKVFDKMLNYKKLPKDLLELYADLYRESVTSKVSNKFKKLNLFFSFLPKIDKLEDIILNNYLSLKEYLLLTIILHILFHYYSNVEINYYLKNQIFVLLEYYIEYYLVEHGFDGIIKSILNNYIYSNSYNILNISFLHLLSLEKIKNNLAYYQLINDNHNLSGFRNENNDFCSEGFSTML